MVFYSVVDDYFLNHSDFTAELEDLTGMPEGPTGNGHRSPRSSFLDSFRVAVLNRPI